MSKICSEAEAAIDHYDLFKTIMRNTPLPMSPLESLASSAVRTAHKVTRLPPAQERTPCAVFSAAGLCSAAI
jgi:hypothetical protein